MLEELPEEDEAEPEDEPDEPPLPAMAEVQASARSRLAVVATKAVRWVIMVWFLKKTVDTTFTCDFFPHAGRLYAVNIPTEIFFV